jgi:hypothetical protein
MKLKRLPIGQKLALAKRRGLEDGKNTDKRKTEDKKR